MRITATTEDAYNLLHEGTLALSEIEANGICVDEDLLQTSIDKVGRQILHEEASLKSGDIWKKWKRKYGAKASLTSRDQLGQVLINQYPEAWRPEDKTATGKPRTDEETLSRIDIPFVQDFLKLQKLIKARNTYLKGIQRETVDGLLHPVFNLGLVRTYRSSSDSPNFQNMPIRTGWMAKLIRSCLKARPGRFLVELDFKGIEVAVSACYNRDPKLIAYVSDPSLDMHRDMAAEIFLCSIDQVTKDTRYNAKNKFVFPEFYGDWYLSCARNLWESVRKMNLELKDGTPMLDHLQAQGISRLGPCDPDKRPLPGTFEKHLQDVEHRFWYGRFSVYQAWKESWYAAYQKQGGFRTLTGFLIQGYMNRKETINYPVQGSAFHCLLWCLIRLQRWIKRHGKQTLLVGQIHDSILADVPEDELGEFLRVAQRIMTELLPQAWEWIVVPLVVEVEATPLGGSWFVKTAVQT